MNQNNEVLQIPIEDLIPNRFQPRISFDEKALNDLANSIRQHGIIQPLVVRRLGEKYEIIAGERRFKAAQIAGLISVPGIVANVNDLSSAEIALVENVQRKDLSSIEEAKSYKNILDKSEMTQDELAKKVGISQSSVANKLRLLNLSDEVQQAILDGKISERHARSLLSLENFEEQNKFLQRIIDERLTVKQLDEEIKNIKNTSKDNEVDDVPLVDINSDLENIKMNATDINPIVDRPTHSDISHNVEANSTTNEIIENKLDDFYNVTNSAIQNSNQDEQKIPETIVTEAPADTILSNELERNPGDEMISAPSSLETSETFNNDMQEEFLEEQQVSDSVIETLDYEPKAGIFDSEVLEKGEALEQTIDLPTIITEIRKNIQKLNVNKNIKISEIDGSTSYNINIEIQKES